MIPPSNDPVSDYEIAEMMRLHGGSFFQQLGELWHLADESNRAKILATWHDDCEEFRELARLKRVRQG